MTMSTTGESGRQKVPYLLFAAMFWLNEPMDSNLMGGRNVIYLSCRFFISLVLKYRCIYIIYRWVSLAVIIIRGSIGTVINRSSDYSE